MRVGLEVGKTNLNGEINDPDLDYPLGNLNQDQVAFGII
jgi:hypothetical protein